MIKKGFTLIELILSMSLSFVCLIILFNLLLHTTKLFESSFLEDEVFENISLAMDFFEKQIRISDEVILPSNDFSTKILTVKINNKSHSFIYNKNAKENSTQYQRLNFGESSNRLATNIENINIEYNDEKKNITITIFPNNIINEDFINFDPMIRIIDLKYKKVTW